MRTGYQPERQDSLVRVMSGPPPCNGGFQMDNITRAVLGSFAALMLAALAVLHAADAPQSATKRNATTDDQADKSGRRPNVLIIGASSLNSPVAQTALVAAMLESKEIRMDIEGAFPRLDKVSEMLSSRSVWDYVIMDAWHLGRASADGSQGNASVPPDFPKALAVFVKQVRAHSPQCKIILFPWWIPRGPTATNEGVMEVFRRCVEQAKANDIWVATTGPAFMEAHLERPDLHITKSKTDAHPGNHGAYIIACSLFAIISGKTPVGLPATLRITAAAGKKEDFAIASGDAQYLQELAWKVYQRESKNTKPKSLVPASSPDTAF